MDAFYLDTRNGYLGRLQTEWLSEKLLNSVAKWKLIFYGLPLCSTSRDISVKDGNIAIHIRTNLDDDEPRGEARVSIQVEDEEEAHPDKYSLFSVLSALTTIFASNITEEQNIRSASPLNAPQTLRAESGLARIKTGIVVISGGRSKYNSVPSGPYVITFTPSVVLNDANDALADNHYYAEVYTGGGEWSLSDQPPLFSAETKHDSMWCSQPSSNSSFVKLFLDGENMLRIELWSFDVDGLSKSDRKLLHESSIIISPRLVFTGALDSLSSLAD